MKIYLVGGAVRDQLLGLPVTERDYVVVGATVADMLQLGYKQVGREFPVFLHPKTNEEYALARMERKVSPGYTGFQFDTSASVTLEEDLKRRDLTINAMAKDLETNDIVDPFHGQKDLSAKILRHVSNAFIEDPVRVLRVGRFLARFGAMGFKVAPNTLQLMQAMAARGEIDALVAERVWKELVRALAEKNPSFFFQILKEAHALQVLFPGTTTTGTSTLKLAEQKTTSPLIRFACFFYDYQLANKTVIDSIAILCNRYRIPNQYQQLLKLVATYYQDALHARESSDENILQLFARLDIYRREQRFLDFIKAVSIIALNINMNFDASWLLDAAHCVKSIDVQHYIRAGYTGQDLAHQLKNERHEKLSTWRKKE